MYYYFDDKTDLYVTVLKDAIARMLAAMHEGADASAGYWGRLEHMFKQSVAFAREHPEFGALARGLLRLRDVDALEAIFDEYRVHTEEMIREGQAMARGADGPPDAAPGSR